MNFKGVMVVPALGCVVKTKKKGNLVTKSALWVLFGCWIET